MAGFPTENRDFQRTHKDSSLVPSYKKPCNGTMKKPLKQSLRGIAHTSRAVAKVVLKALLRPHSLKQGIFLRVTILFKRAIFKEHLWEYWEYWEFKGLSLLLWS